LIVVLENTIMALDAEAALPLKLEVSFLLVQADVSGEPATQLNLGVRLQSMSIETPLLAAEISLLMSRLAEMGDIPEDEVDVAIRLHALPVGADFAYCLLSPECAVISYDPPHEPELAKDAQSLLHTLVYASQRYPSLSRFIPSRPASVASCELCSGTGVRGVYIGTNRPARCPFCAGLGWDTRAA
jgi:hypothetical protein